MLQQDLRFASAALRLVANVAFTIDEVKKLLVIPLEVQLLDLFGHDGNSSVLQRVGFALALRGWIALHQSLPGSFERELGY
jgi:hypothetical protein